jgi:hypothetical protein
MGNEGNRRPRVVVVGGGFAELSAVRELGGAQPVSSRRCSGDLDRLAGLVR